VSAREFDEEHHLDLALAPWVFQSMPGARPAQWPLGLPEFVERLESLTSRALWPEPLDTLAYGVEFLEGARRHVRDQTERLAELSREDESGAALLAPGSAAAELSRDLGLALRAFLGVAVLSASSDLLLEGLALQSRVDTDCGEKYAAAVFGHCRASLTRFLRMLRDESAQRSQLRYLDTTNASGVFSVAKYVSFAQQTEHNTSITTDGEYLYMYVAVPQKAAMYKIGTGSSEATLPGKIYLEKKAERDGEVAWTYCQGKLYARRAGDEFGLLTLYDAETLDTIGDARLLCNDIFTSSNCLQANRSCPILSDGRSLYVVTMKVVQKRRAVRPDMRQQYAQLQQSKPRPSSKPAKDAEASRPHQKPVPPSA
jgi:hypothetical protein